MVADVVAAIDFGSTLSRAVCTLNGVELEPELILITPQVVRLPQKSIENYEQYKIGESTPENCAWVKVFDEYFAIGFLAKSKFHISFSLQALKIDSAILQTLALLGIFAQQKQLSSFSLSLGIVLPWNELKDKNKFESKITQALSSFTFRGQSLSIKLESFIALPEGAGIFSRGRIPLSGEFLLRDPKTINIAVVMLGYRNSSILIIKNGELNKGATGDFGLARMIEKIQSATSGQSPEMLIPVISQARSNKLGKRVLGTLARSHRKDLREMEIEEIAVAVNDARSEYISLLTTWLWQNLPHDISIDELLISGGTSLYLKTELMQIFKSFSTEINWGQLLEERLTQTFGNVVSHNALEHRLADVYGLFYTLLNRPIPLLKNLDGEFENVRAS